MLPFAPARDDNNQVFQGDLFQDDFIGVDCVRAVHATEQEQECIQWHQYRQQESVQDWM
jgi:uncharacterized protein YbaA (DUF1428 family)